MIPEIRRYLNDMKWRLKLDPKAETDVIRELGTHLEDEADELYQSGFTEEEAARIATERFGPARALAREIYQVYSKGTIGEALLAALPHFLIAATFIFHLWREWLWIMALLICMVLVTLYKLRQGKPVWLYPWLGYCLAALPVLVLVLWQVIPVSNPSLWLVLLVYVPFALWLLASALFLVVRRDWLLASLMILPVPPAIAWLWTLEREGLIPNDGGLNHISPQIALTFLSLGVITAAFISLRRRLVKVGLLLGTTLVTVIIILPVTLWSLVLALFLTGSLLLPGLVEHKMGHRWRGSEV